MSPALSAGESLTVGAVEFAVQEHPVVPGVAYGQEGRCATVYQLRQCGGVPTALGVHAGEDRRALKVFKTGFHDPALVSLAERLAPLAAVPGLAACERSVLTPQRHGPLLRSHPELIYAVVMPWVSGPAWAEVQVSKRVLSVEQSAHVAYATADVLTQLEQRGAAHCDISGSNILIPLLDAAPLPPNRLAAELVDVEQLHAPGLDRPRALSGGYPGYAHQSAHVGLWDARADRFAGAILLAEMLGWCDPRVRDAAWGESYFDPSEMHTACRRYDLLAAVLRERWSPALAGLLDRAWRSATLDSCATFGEWLLALPATGARAGVSAAAPANAATAVSTGVAAVSTATLPVGASVGPVDAAAGGAAWGPWRRVDAPEEVLMVAGAAIPVTLQPVPTVIPPTSAAAGSSVPAGGDPPAARKAQWELRQVDKAWGSVPSRGSRNATLRNLFIAFASTAAGLLFLIPAFGEPITRAGSAAYASAGTSGYLAVAGAVLAGMVGALELWIFRGRVSASRRLPFLLSTVIGGAIGGAAGGFAVDGAGLAGGAAGAVIGVVAGVLAATGQNLAMRSRAERWRWFWWNVVMWTAAWWLATAVGWNMDDLAATTIGAPIILLITGTSLTAFLRYSPDIEF